MRLEKVGIVTHGIVLNRVKPKLGKDSANYPVFTIKEFLNEIGKLDKLVDTTFINVRRDKDITLSQMGMVAICLTSLHKAVVINERQSGKIIPSNFCYIEFNKSKVDPFYFSWYFNEHPEIQKQLSTAIQGNSSIRVLSVQLIRELDITIPDLKLQKTIGKAYYLRNKKEKLIKEKMELEKTLFNKTITYTVNRKNRGLNNAY